jgi:DNA-binding winged helix-turn-helix (wHTH) protein
MTSQNMTEKTVFYIAGFEVDLNRSMIKGELKTQVEPKALKVLQLLAQRQNEVVTYDEITDQVWQGAEVVPSALQRCITILRKALGDDAKSPSIITTHPKIGYRLQAHVQWQSMPKSQPDNSASMTQKEDKSDAHWTKKTVSLTRTGLVPAGLTFLTLFALIAIVVVSAGKFWQQSFPVQYTQIRPLTQTDAHESHALFSPNTEYVVFNRYAGGCKSHLWARNISEGKEIKLTAEPGYYGAVSFTGDGRELVFAAKKQCQQSGSLTDAQNSEQFCWNIATLDFAFALSEPQQPAYRHQCQAERLENPKALSNHQYAFLQFNDQRYQLMHYDDLSKKLTTLYSPNPKKQYLYHFDYDPTDQRFSVISRDSESRSIVEILTEKGQILSSETIQLADNMSRNQFFSGNFEPQGKYLLAISNKSLYKIDFNGQVQQLKTPESNLISIAKHPDKQYLLAVKGHKDVDIAQVTIGEEQAASETIELNQKVMPYNSLARSSAQDRHARYQPKGGHIAFISDRSGQDQLWLWYQGQASQLSAVSSQKTIHNFSWSPNGKSLAWVSNDRLAISDLKGELYYVDTDKPLYSVLSWYSQNQLLVLLNDPMPGGLYLLDIEQNQLSAFAINQVKTAWVHNDQLFYSDVNDDVYIRFLGNQTNQSKLLPQLSGRAMFLSNQSIYSVDQNKLLLNQYNLKGEFIKQVMSLKALGWKVTDVKENKVLLDQFISINQEIVILE